MAIPTQARCSLLGPRRLNFTAGFRRLNARNESSDFWRTELAEGKEAWYQQSLQYWNRRSATYKDVLTGHPELNDADIKYSKKFLAKVITATASTSIDGKSLMETERSTRVLDAGCGSGRVTKQILKLFFDKVELLEPVEHLLDHAENEAGKQFAASYCTSLQHFEPLNYRYDCIWFQWVISNLTDDDVVTLLQKCTRSLQPNGFIIIKENLSKDGEPISEIDSSVTRGEEHYQELFDESRLVVLQQGYQEPWDESLCKVKMWALVQSPSS